MLNSATAQPVTHVLVFDEDAPQLVGELGHNTLVVSDCYRRLLAEDSDHVMELKYKVVFVVRAASNLVAPCQTISAELKVRGIHTYVAQVKAEDMLAFQGRIGLFGCAQWCIPGAVLLNEVPISEVQAEKLLYQANRFDYTSYHLVLLQQGWFQLNVRLGLIRSGASIGHLFRGNLTRFPDRHSVSDILRTMRDNCSGKDLFVVK